MCRMGPGGLSGAADSAVWGNGRSEQLEVREACAVQVKARQEITWEGGVSAQT